MTPGKLYKCIEDVGFDDDFLEKGDIFLLLKIDYYRGDNYITILHKGKTSVRDVYDVEMKDWFQEI